MNPSDCFRPLNCGTSSYQTYIKPKGSSSFQLPSSGDTGFYLKSSTLGTYLAFKFTSVDPKDKTLAGGLNTDKEHATVFYWDSSVNLSTIFNGTKYYLRYDRGCAAFDEQQLSGYAYWTIDQVNKRIKAGSLWLSPIFNDAGKLIGPRDYIVTGYNPPTPYEYTQYDIELVSPGRNHTRKRSYTTPPEKHQPLYLFSFDSDTKIKYYLQVMFDYDGSPYQVRVTSNKKYASLFQWNDHEEINVLTASNCQYDHIAMKDLDLSNNPILVPSLSLTLLSVADSDIFTEVVVYETNDETKDMNLRSPQTTWVLDDQKRLSAPNQLYNHVDSATLWRDVQPRCLMIVPSYQDVMSQVYHRLSYFVPGTIITKPSLQQWDFEYQSPSQR